MAISATKKQEYTKYCLQRHSRY